MSALSPPSKLWKCVCGECDPDAPNSHLYNCGRCGYLALSSPHEDTLNDDGQEVTETHRCPACGESWWLFHEVWSQLEGLWVARVA